MEKELANCSQRNVRGLSQLSQSAQDDMYEKLSGKEGIAAQTIAENNTQITSYDSARAALLAKNGGGEAGPETIPTTRHVRYSCVAAPTRQNTHRQFHPPAIVRMETIPQKPVLSASHAAVDHPSYARQPNSSPAVYLASFDDSLHDLQLPFSPP